MSEHATPTTADGAGETISDDKEKSLAKDKNWTSYAPLVVAMAALIGFASIIAYLLSRTIAATELEWTRAVYLLNGVEAIAFAAAGFLFGKEVHRQQAESAQERAKEAEVEAAEARTAASEAERSSIEAETKGKAVAAAVRAMVTAQNGEGEGEFQAFGPVGERQLPTGESKQPAVLAELRALIDELYPK